MSKEGESSSSAYDFRCICGVTCKKTDSEFCGGQLWINCDLCRNSRYHVTCLAQAGNLSRGRYVCPRCEAKTSIYPIVGRYAKDLKLNDQIGGVYNGLPNRALIIALIGIPDLPREEHDCIREIAALNHFLEKGSWDAIPEYLRPYVRVWDASRDAVMRRFRDNLEHLYNRTGRKYVSCRCGVNLEDKGVHFQLCHVRDCLAIRCGRCALADPTPPPWICRRCSISRAMEEKRSAVEHSGPRSSRLPLTPSAPRDGSKIADAYSPGDAARHYLPDKLNSEPYSSPQDGSARPGTPLSAKTALSPGQMDVQPTINDATGRYAGTSPTRTSAWPHPQVPLATDPRLPRPAGTSPAASATLDSSRPGTASLGTVKEPTDPPRDTPLRVDDRQMLSRERSSVSGNRARSPSRLDDRRGQGRERSPPRRERGISPRRSPRRDSSPVRPFDRGRDRSPIRRDRTASPGYDRVVAPARDRSPIRLDRPHSPTRASDESAPARGRSPIRLERSGSPKKLEDRPAPARDRSPIRSRFSAIPASKDARVPPSIASEPIRRPSASRFSDPIAPAATSAALPIRLSARDGPLRIVSGEAERLAAAPAAATGGVKPLQLAVRSGENPVVPQEPSSADLAQISHYTTSARRVPSATLPDGRQTSAPLPAGVRPDSTAAKAASELPKPRVVRLSMGTKAQLEAKTATSAQLDANTATSAPGTAAGKHQEPPQTAAAITASPPAFNGISVSPRGPLEAGPQIQFKVGDCLFAFGRFPHSLVMLPDTCQQAWPTLPPELQKSALHTLSTTLNLIKTCCGSGIGLAGITPLKQKGTIGISPGTQSQPSTSKSPDEPLLETVFLDAVTELDKAAEEQSIASEPPATSPTVSMIGDGLHPSLTNGKVRPIGTVMENQELSTAASIVFGGHRIETLTPAATEKLRASMQDIFRQRKRALNAESATVGPPADSYSGKKRGNSIQPKNRAAKKARHLLLLEEESPLTDEDDMDVE